MPFVFPKGRIRLTYEETLNSHRKGYLSLGFIWEIAERDEVFAAYLRKHGVKELTEQEKASYVKSDWFL